MKNIKIQNNLNIQSSYKTDCIEKVSSGSMKQHVKYETIEEYSLPFGCYAELRNSTNTLFDSATKMTELNGIKYANKIIEKESTPTCEEMSNLYSTYVGSQFEHDEVTIKGVVVIDKSKEVYNEIVFVVNQIQNVQNEPSYSYRITDIYLKGEYNTLDEAKIKINNSNPVILDFDSVYTMCAKYWKEIIAVDSNTSLESAEETSTISKSSAFGMSEDQNNIYGLPGFVGGFGDEKYSYYKYEPGSGSGSGSFVPIPEPGSGGGSGEGDEIYKIYEGRVEYWRKINVQDYSQFVTACGQYYQAQIGAETSIEVYDKNYNIFDILFRYLYGYLCDTNIETMPVSYPVTSKFLLKSYKMYLKDQSDDTLHYTNDINNINNYTVEVLSTDGIKSLSFDDAQEYFNNTIVHNIQEYKNKLILSSSEAKNVLIQKGITECNKFFILSNNVGIQVPSNTHNTYYDLGNFELKYTTDETETTYKYNTEGNIVRVRQIYDPLSNEYYIVSQNNSGEFPEEYTIDRNGVCVRSISGNEDYYYFDETSEGKEYAEQLKNDILYGIEDGPNIIVCENLVSMS